MNIQPDKTTFAPGNFISEDAVRDALQRRSQTDPAPAEGAVPAEQAAGTRRLRRWSVAELIAQAVLRGPAGGVAH